MEFAEILTELRNEKNVVTDIFNCYTTNIIKDTLFNVIIQDDDIVNLFVMNKYFTNINNFDNPSLIQIYVDPPVAVDKRMIITKSFNFKDITYMSFIRYPMKNIYVRSINKDNLKHTILSLDQLGSSETIKNYLWECNCLLSRAIQFGILVQMLAVSNVYISLTLYKYIEPLITTYTTFKSISVYNQFSDNLILHSADVTCTLSGLSLIALP